VSCERLPEQDTGRDRKERLALLDQALLFLSSFMSFFFGVTVFYINPSGGTALSSLAVFVVVTTVLPLYVGVMRGGIESGDKIRERVRGWIYLIFGGGLFLLFLISHLTLVPVTPTTPISTALYDDALSLIFIPAMVLIISFTMRFVSWCYKTIEGSAPSGQDLAAIHGTMGAIFVSIIFFVGIALLGQGFNTYPITDPTEGRIYTIASSFFLLIPLLVVEFNAHHESLVVEAEKGYQERIAKNFPPEVLARKSLGVRIVMPIIEVGGRSMYMLAAGFDRKSPAIGYFLVFALLFLVGATLPADYFTLSVSMIVLSEVLLYYGVLKHMNKILRDEAFALRITTGRRS